MYAIENESAWIQASPNAAAERATHNNGGLINSANLAKLPDDILSALGVRRLDRPAESPPNTYMNVSPGTITPAGNRAAQSLVYTDMPLEQAQKACASEIINRAASARQQGVIVQGRKFDTDPEAVDRYSLIGSAMGAGVAYPAGGIPLYCTDISDKTTKRVRLDSAQFGEVVQAVSELLVKTADDEDTLLTLAETAADIDAVRAIDIDAVWPLANNPPGR